MPDPFNKYTKNNGQIKYTYFKLFCFDKINATFKACFKCFSKETILDLLLQVKNVVVIIFSLKKP